MTTNVVPTAARLLEIRKQFSREISRRRTEAATRIARGLVHDDRLNTTDLPLSDDEVDAMLRLELKEEIVMAAYMMAIEKDLGDSR